MLYYPVTTALCLLLIAANAWWGKRLLAQDCETRWRRTLGWFALIAWGIMNTWLFLPANFDPELSWPIHICDLAGLIGPIALLTNRRVLRTVLYFWAMALTTQAFITPVIDEGPEHWKYWFFWANHTLVVGLAVYDLVVGGYRPIRRDLWMVIAITTVWFVLTIVVNGITGHNYGYTGQSKPDNPTVIDLLGTWPTRLLWMALIAIAGFVLVWLPWAVVGRMKKPATGAGRESV